MGAVAVSVLIARLLGERPIGEYGYAQTLAGITLALCGVGLPSYLVQAVSRESATAGHWRELARTVIGGYLTAVLPLALIVLLVVNLLLGGRLGRASIIVPAVASTFALAAGGMFVACLQGLGDFRSGLQAAVALRLLALVAVLFVYLSDGGIATYLSLLTGIQVAAGVFLASRLRTLCGEPIVAIASRRFMRHVRLSVPFGLTVLLELAYYRVDTLVVQWVLGPQATGWYVVAFTAYSAPLLLSYSVATAFFPFVARRSATGVSHAAAGRITAYVLLAYGLLAGAALAFIGPYILVAVFGPRYASSTDVLRILACSVPFAAVNRLWVMTLKGTDRAPAAAAASLLAAVVAIGGNVVAVPRYGIIGAAWVNLATEATLLLATAVAVARSRPRAPQRPTPSSTP